MSTSLEIINTISGHISDAFDAVTEAGGTVPAGAKLKDLPAATATIPASSAGSWGTVTYYTGYNWDYELGTVSGCTVDSIDKTKYRAFLVSIGAGNTTSSAAFQYYDEYWNVEIYAGEEPIWTSIPASQLYERTGISASDVQEFAGIDVRPLIVKDKTSSMATLRLNTQEEYNALSTSETIDGIPHYRVGSITFPKACLNSFKFGVENITTPRAFLSSSGVELIDFSEASSLTTIGDAFADSTRYISSPIVVSNTVTSIGEYFMSGSRYNLPITLSSSLTTLGKSFLFGCGAFNYPLVLPNTLTSIPNSFLSGCYSFNQPITLPNACTSIGEDFLNACYSFNQNIVLPSTITQIGTGWGFLHECRAMTSSVNVGNISADVITDSTNHFSTNYNSYPQYTTGITLVGATAADWKAKLPDRTTRPYRKLIVNS